MVLAFYVSEIKPTFTKGVDYICSYEYKRLSDFPFVFGILSLSTVQNVEATDVFRLWHPDEFGTVDREVRRADGRKGNAA